MRFCGSVYWTKVLKLVVMLVVSVLRRLPWQSRNETVAGAGRLQMLATVPRYMLTLAIGLSNQNTIGTS